MQLTKQEIEAIGEEQELPLYDIYGDYCSDMRKQSLMDYDDQMIYAYTMLKSDGELLDRFQEHYKYICVDEAQDTSKIQHMIISLLADKYKNLFMVGDEDQSIYGFRAAYPDALLNFEKNYDNARVLLMEENFRSSAKIVNAADRFIQLNELRHKKSMRPTREEGTDIREIEIKSRRAQYTYLTKVAGNCLAQTAVLYRDSESVLPLVDLLERHGIDYKIKNADLTFFSNKVVNDITNVIKFAYNQTDIEIFMQIYYKIGTFISKTAALDACRASKEHQIPILQAALDYGRLAPATIKSVKSIQTHLNELVDDPADRAIYRIVNYMGYKTYLDRMNIKDGKIKILDAIGFNEPTPIRFVERLGELSNIIKEKKSSPDCLLTLSTIHSSKGLEYDTVYIMDAKDGVFPEKVIKDRKTAQADEIKEYEEERRLYYVGVTRAKNHLNIFSFKNNATFTYELLGKSTKPEVRQHARKNLLLSKSAFTQSAAKRTVTESEYLDKLEEIRSTGKFKHKTYGEGKAIGFDGDTIEVQFANKKAKCKLKFMMENGLII
jgi:DNA helicase-2/ATP-dependent DNA helicase PcrA